MIFVVDDYQDGGRMLTLLLESVGLTARHFESGSQALKAMAVSKPSLVILDQMMPEVLGTDVLEAMRSAPALADIATIFYTATYEGRELAYELGAKAWIIKGQAGWNELLTQVLNLYVHSHPMTGKEPLQFQ